MAEENLKNKAINGVFWTALDKVGVKGVTFIVSIIIARILTPADYGTIGMILVFMTIANIFIDSGISQALIQKQDRTQIDLSSALWFNIGVSIICYIILFLCAPLIARFYEVPQLCSILRILGLNLIINSFSVVQRATVSIALNFKIFTAVNLCASLFSGGVGIIMAYNGFGVWALVAQQITTQFIATLVLWSLNKWRPTTVFSKKSISQLWNFGWKLLASGLVATILREIYALVIGKVYRQTELGLYSRATQTSELIAYTTNDIINAITFPILSSLQNDRERLISVYSRMLGMTAFFIIPIMTLMAVVAKPLFLFLLTEKWIMAVPLFQWLCLARLFTPISSLNMNILNAVGRSDLFMKLDFSKIPLTILTMAITLPIGVEAVVIGNFINTFICYFINAYLPGKIFGFGIKAQSKIFYKIILATSGMVIITFLSLQIPLPLFFHLIIPSFIGFISYIILCYFLRIDSLKEITLISKNLIFHRA